MVKMNLVRTTALASAASDRDVSRCARVTMTALRGITPAHDQPFVISDGHGRPMKLIQLDRPLPVWGYRAVGSHK